MDGWMDVDMDMDVDVDMDMDSWVEAQMEARQAIDQQGLCFQGRR